MSERGSTVPIAVRRVLLVDDDSMYRIAFSRAMRPFNFAVSWADDGPEAVRLVDQHGCSYFDVVVLDYYMPGMTGGQTANEIRKLCPDIAILYMSGSGSFPEDMKSPDPIAREAFLPKPSPARLIVRTIAELLKGGQRE